MGIVKDIFIGSWGQYARRYCDGLDACKCNSRSSNGKERKVTR